MIVRLNDLIVRIKNAYARRMKSIKIDRTNRMLDVVRCLSSKRYVDGFSYGDRWIVIRLKYNLESEPFIRILKHVSTPTRKVFLSHTMLSQQRFLGGFMIMSTNQGIRSSDWCLRNKVGGLALELVSAG